MPGIIRTRVGFPTSFKTNALFLKNQYPKVFLKNIALKKFEKYFLVEVHKVKYVRFTFCIGSFYRCYFYLLK